MVTLFDGLVSAEVAANLDVLFKIVVGFFLGLLVGYERSYHGRAAGMRTYALVCMSSCAIVAICGDMGIWFGGMGQDFAKYADPGRAIQGITTGIGFLGAGVIMRDGLSISGLTTAASIWSVSAIGVLVGVGFYGAATGLSVLLAVLMMWGSKIESILPMRHAVSITLIFHRNSALTQEEVTHLIHTQGFEIAGGSFSITHRDGQTEWRFVGVSCGKRKSASLVKLSEMLHRARGIQDFTIVHARN